MNRLEHKGKAIIVKINKKLVAALITIILSFAFGLAVEANTNEWRFELTPYFWASEADIDAATINGQTASAAVIGLDMMPN
jgi:hypothetical protein